MDTKPKKWTELRIRVGLNADKIPVSMKWQSEDSADPKDWKEMKAFALSLFEESRKETYKIDLWTSRMQVDEMDRFMFNTLKGLADSYFRATNNQKLSNEFQSFIRYFGEETKIL